MAVVNAWLQSLMVGLFTWTGTTTWPVAAWFTALIVGSSSLFLHQGAIILLETQAKSLNDFGREAAQPGQNLHRLHLDLIVRVFQQGEQNLD